MLTILLLYVDDIILTRNLDAFLSQLMVALNAEFSMKDLGPLFYFLRFKVHKSGTNMQLSP